MRQLPTTPGDYHWDEWDKVVRVYERGHEGRLYVRAFSHWKPIRITNRIAGTFTPVPVPEAPKA